MSGIKRNMGTLDRSLRLVGGCILIYLTLIDSSLIQSDVVRYLLAALAIGNIISAIISFCPMYVPAGINTYKKSTSATN